MTEYKPFEGKPENQIPTAPGETVSGLGGIQPAPGGEKAPLEPVQTSAPEPAPVGR